MQLGLLYYSATLFGTVVLSTGERINYTCFITVTYYR